MKIKKIFISRNRVYIIVKGLFFHNLFEPKHIIFLVNLVWKEKQNIFKDLRMEKIFVLGNRV